MFREFGVFGEIWVLGEKMTKIGEKLTKKRPPPRAQRVRLAGVVGGMPREAAGSDREVPRGGVDQALIVSSSTGLWQLVGTGVVSLSGSSMGKIFPMVPSLTS